jgi:hypothetical protein
MAEPTYNFVAGQNAKASEVNQNFIEALNDYRDFVYGETIAVNDALYLKSDGKVYKTSASYNDERIHNFVGFAKEAGTSGQTKKVQIAGIVKNLNAFTLSDVVSETLDQSQSVSIDTNNSIKVKSEYPLHQTFATGDNVGNISKLELYLKRWSATADLVIEIYRVDANGLPTGSPLWSISVPYTSISTWWGWHTFTSGLPVELNPRETYVIKLSTTDADGYSWANNDYVRFPNPYKRGFERQRIWDAAQMNLDAAFKTYYTARKFGSIGNNLYLGDTAGSISLDEGTYRKKIGKLLTTTSLLIETKETEDFVRMYGINSVVEDQDNYYPAERNVRKVIASSSWISHEIILTKLGKDKGANNVSWVGNEIRVSSGTYKVYLFR